MENHGFMSSPLGDMNPSLITPSMYKTERQTQLSRLGEEQLPSRSSCRCVSVNTDS